MQLKFSLLSTTWQPFYLGLNVLNTTISPTALSHLRLETASCDREAFPPPDDSASSPQLLAP